MQKPKNKQSLPFHGSIVLTGGHAATTALATIESLSRMTILEQDISWIGAKTAVEGSKALTLEFKVFPKYGIKCFGITTGRLQRKWTRYSVISFIKIPLGFLHAFLLLTQIRPRAIVSFGGFAAFPVVLTGWLLGIPVVIHEQTLAAGLANRLCAPFAKYVAISREESAKYFPGKKTILTGNPVRRKFFEIKRKKKPANLPIIYATGGSRGAQNFNKVLREAVPRLLKDYQIIHHTGELDLPVCQQLRNSLPVDLKKRYEIHAFIDPEVVPDIFEKADIVIGRAGANTVAEVIAARRPAIFVPIPWAQHDEQTKNARLAEAAGMARIINQSELSPLMLINTIKEVTKNWQKMALGESSIRDLDKAAAAKLVHIVEGLAQ